jgi:hypothetical protein
VRVAVASVGQSHVKIAAGAVADVVYEFVGAASVVLEGVFAVLGVREGKVALAGGLELGGLVDEVFGHEASVVVADVAVSASAVGTIVDHLALGRHCFVSLHLIKLLV